MQIVVETDACRLASTYFLTTISLQFKLNPVFNDFIRVMYSDFEISLGWRALKTPTAETAHASLPLAQTPCGLTGRAWLQAGTQQVAIVVSHN